MDAPPLPSPRRAAQVRPELTIGQLTVQEQRDPNALGQRCHMMRISPQKEPLRVLPMDVDLSGVRQRLQVGVNVPNGAEHAAVIRRQRERELLGEIRIILHIASEAQRPNWTATRRSRRRSTSASATSREG